MKRALDLSVAKPAKKASQENSSTDWQPQIQEALKTLGLVSLRLGQQPAVVAALQGSASRKDANNSCITHSSLGPK